jgi:hypothetical protein
VKVLKVQEEFVQLAENLGGKLKFFLLFIISMNPIQLESCCHPKGFRRRGLPPRERRPMGCRPKASLTQRRRESEREREKEVAANFQ